ncbi:MAG: 2'-5' RNA ligase family protein [Nitrososphaerota archaeon]|nr:2'-5' RNA ligase family protein [Nitrososphaerota archaeon]
MGVLEVTPVSEYWGQFLNSGETVYAGLIYRVPPRLWRSLTTVQKQLKTLDPRQLYPTPGNFHIPVKGLGYLGEEVDRDGYERTLAQIEKIVSEFDSFEIHLCGLGVFPTGIYARVEDGGKFRAINERISEELKGKVDSSKYDVEAYVPHVTLASFNTKDVMKLLEKVNSEPLKDCEFGPAGVFEIEVVRTNLILALGPEETQDRAYSYIRSFWLGNFNH